MLSATLRFREQIVDATQLGPEIPHRWNDTLDDTCKKITGTRVADLASSEQVNTIKSLLLIAAITAQVVAVLLLAWSVSGLLR